MDNLKFYNKARTVPDTAKKAIGAGRLKGKTDINPMWRIKVLTEMFGPCGVGWWYEITDKKILEDAATKQKAAFVDIVLFYIDPESGHTSHGIPGTGGSSFVSKESSGLYMSDECFKMALTDAISVAAKAIGVGADVYYERDATKYSQRDDNCDNASKAWNVALETAEEVKRKKAEYAAAIAEAKALLETVTDADSANAASLKLKSISHALTSERDVGIMWNRHIKSLGLFYDRVLKAYTPGS